jgi:hypothetical protein
MQAIGMLNAHEGLINEKLVLLKGQVGSNKQTNAEFTHYSSMIKRSVREFEMIKKRLLLFHSKLRDMEPCKYKWGMAWNKHMKMCVENCVADFDGTMAAVSGSILAIPLPSETLPPPPPRVS